MEIAELEILRNVQQFNFLDELELLSKSENGTQVKKSSSLRSLDPILVNGVLCVGGRLSLASTAFEAKHQIILPKKDHVTNLVVEYYHQISGHSGREYVISLASEKFWIVNASSVVRKVLSKCFSCRLRQCLFCEQKMADLPVDRVTPGHPPFISVSVDCFGPLQVHHGQSLVKRYGVIFTCLAIRGVHIEVAHSLETDSFLMALRRFIARRGQVKEIRSDNGTNFTGGERAQGIHQRMESQQDSRSSTSEEYQVELQSPYGSHCGGVWERCIRTTRKVLVLCLKLKLLTTKASSPFYAKWKALLKVVQSPQFQVTLMIRSPLQQTICFLYAQILRCPLGYSKRKTPSLDADGDKCNTSQISIGRDGLRSTCLCSKVGRNGRRFARTWPLGILF